EQCVDGGLVRTKDLSGTSATVEECSAVDPSSPISPYSIAIDSQTVYLTTSPYGIWSCPQIEGCVASRLYVRPIGNAELPIHVGNIYFNGTDGVDSGAFSYNIASKVTKLLNKGPFLFLAVQSGSVFTAGWPATTVVEIPPAGAPIVLAENQTHVWDVA